MGGRGAAVFGRTAALRGRVGGSAIPGAVRVPALGPAAPPRGVGHLVARLPARGGVEVPRGAVLDAPFPPASVTGTPKLRARELLAEWEPHRRGVYCGAV